MLTYLKLSAAVGLHFNKLEQMTVVPALLAWCPKTLNPKYILNIVNITPSAHTRLVKHILISMAYSTGMCVSITLDTLCLDA